MTDPDSERSPKPEASRPADDQGADTAVPHDEELDESGSDSLRDLLRGAAAQDEPPMPDVLRGVQRKIRVRSRGKYFADVWSTSRQPPISTYLVTSLVMLAIAAFVYVVLSPLSGEPVKVEPPAPINVVPPSPY
jgi:hypothetical protein